MKRLIPLCFVLSAGCASHPPAIRLREAQARNSQAAPSTPAAAAASEPTGAQGLSPRQALTREVKEPLTRTRVESQEAAFRGEVLAVSEPTVETQSNGVSLLTLPMGSHVPISCFLYPNPIDAGAAARLLIESLLEKVKLESVRATDVKAYAGSPALYLDADYSHQGKVGRLKVMVHADPVLAKACVHDALGYSQTFQRVTESVATGVLSTAQEQPVPPYYSEVQVARVGEQVIGFQTFALFKAQEGGILFEENSTLVSPGAPPQVRYQDTSRQEHSNETGAVVSKSYSKRLGDAPAEQARVRREQDGSYVLEGQLDGKDVHTRMGGELLSVVGFAQRVREGLLKNGTPVEAAMWIPANQPSSPTPVVMKPRTGAGPRSATMEMGSLSTHVELDDHGFIERQELPAGKTSLVIERISRTGTP
ncbi:hypothetical protein [Cystobacter fuscus]|uniref:hypothetical protein n=1 Tax=Cystobacter fuscus TaxID=43 RepID=UPI0037BFC349